MFKTVFLFVTLAVASLEAFVPGIVSRAHSRLAATKIDDKVEVKEYFDTEGFKRWNKIYSDSSEVNKVQLDIRTGHQKTIDKVIAWVSAEDNSKKTLCDAGCGVGSLALPLASKFANVYASDISTSMTQEAAARAKDSKIKNVKVS